MEPSPSEKKLLAKWKDFHIRRSQDNIRRLKEGITAVLTEAAQADQEEDNPTYWKHPLVVWVVSIGQQQQQGAGAPSRKASQRVYPLIAEEEFALKDAVKKEFPAMPALPDDWAESETANYIKLAITVTNHREEDTGKLPDFSDAVMADEGWSVEFTQKQLCRMLSIPKGYCLHLSYNGEALDDPNKHDLKSNEITNPLEDPFQEYHLRAIVVPTVEEDDCRDDPSVTDIAQSHDSTTNKATSSTPLLTYSGSSSTTHTTSTYHGGSCNNRWGSTRSYYATDESWPTEVSDQYGRGACGLSNLGNTCFMNSGIQCLSNCAVFRNYFLKPKYELETDINMDNPLGHKGAFARAFARLLQNMWSGEHSHCSPRNFLDMLQSNAPQFRGYSQQDSVELLCYLLDGLHEDLNRIKHKKYVELTESDGREDAVVAAESWEKHMQRNDSIVVDFFHGQLKSTVACTNCPKVSVTFDPFLQITLPLYLNTNRWRAYDVMVLRTNLKLHPPIVYRVKLGYTATLKDMCAELKTLVGTDELHITDTLGNDIAADESLYHHYRREYFAHEVSQYHMYCNDPQRYALLSVEISDAADPYTYYYNKTHVIYQVVPRDITGKALYELFHAIHIEYYALPDPTNPDLQDPDVQQLMEDVLTSQPVNTVTEPHPSSAWAYQQTETGATKSWVGDGSYDQHDNSYDGQGDDVGDSQYDDHGGCQDDAYEPSTHRDSSDADPTSTYEDPGSNSTPYSPSSSPHGLTTNHNYTEGREFPAEDWDDAANIQPTHTAVRDFCDDPGEDTITSATASTVEAPSTTTTTTTSSPQKDQEQCTDENTQLHVFPKPDATGSGVTSHQLSAETVEAVNTQIMHEMQQNKSKDVFSDTDSACAQGGDASDAGSDGRLQQSFWSGGEDMTGNIGSDHNSSDTELDDTHSPSQPLRTSWDHPSGMVPASLPEAPSADTADPNVKEPDVDESKQGNLSQDTVEAVSGTSPCDSDATILDPPSAVDSGETKVSMDTLMKRLAHKPQLLYGFKLTGSYEGPSVSWAYATDKFCVATGDKVWTDSECTTISANDKPPLADIQVTRINIKMQFNAAHSGAMDIYKLSETRHESCDEIKVDDKGHPEAEPLSLQECLDFFHSKEKLGESEEWYCPNCTTHIRAWKQLQLYSLPRILVISLKRFEWGGQYSSRQKIEQQVMFPLTGLDVRRWLVDPSKYADEDITLGTPSETVYDLYAVSNHYGGMGGGHYTACARNEEGQWFKYDDSFCETIDGDPAYTVVTSAAYCLFYIRRATTLNLEKDPKPEFLQQQSGPLPPFWSYEEGSTVAQSSQQVDYGRDNSVDDDVVKSSSADGSTKLSDDNDDWEFGKNKTTSAETPSEQHSHEYMMTHGNTTAHPFGVADSEDSSSTTTTTRKNVQQGALNAFPPQPVTNTATNLVDTEDDDWGAVDPPCVLGQQNTLNPDEDHEFTKEASKDTTDSFGSSGSFGIEFGAGPDVK